MLNHHGLSERITTIEQMRQEAAAWNDLRNKKVFRLPPLAVYFILFLDEFVKMLFIFRHYFT